MCPLPASRAKPLYRWILDNISAYSTDIRAILDIEMKPGQAVGLFQRYLGGLEEEGVGGRRASRPNAEAVGNGKGVRVRKNSNPGPAVDARIL